MLGLSSKTQGSCLLDEATSALDTHQRRSSRMHWSRPVRTGRPSPSPIVCPPSRMQTKIVVMGKGVILETGKHDELLELNGAYAQLSMHRRSAPRSAQTPSKMGKSMRRPLLLQRTLLLLLKRTLLRRTRRKQCFARKPRRRCPLDSRRATPVKVSPVPS